MIGATLLHVQTFSYSNTKMRKQKVVSDRIIYLNEQERASPSDSEAENFSDDEEELGDREKLMEKCRDEEVANDGKHGN